jgi:glucokinase
MTAQALAIDIGGTKILAALVDAKGAIGALVQVATPAREGRDAIIAAVLSAARQALRAAREPVRACGVGTAGVVGPSGEIASATDLLSGWAGTKLGAWLAAELGMVVRVMNDVQATALCEARLGAARGYASALVVAVGTGIGGAIVRDGEVVVGAHGIAGSIGHLPAPIRRGLRCSCGVPDHIEAHASGPALEAEYFRRTGRKLDLQAIAMLGNDGDAVARSVLVEGASALGAVIGGANNLVDAAIILVGGGVASIGDLFLDPLRAAAREQALGASRDVPISVAGFGSNACLVGAGLLGLSKAGSVDPPCESAGSASEGPLSSDNPT